MYGGDLENMNSFLGTPTVSLISKIHRDMKYLSGCSLNPMCVLRSHMRVESSLLFGTYHIY